MKKHFILFVVLFLLTIIPSKASAVLQSLNGLGGQNQTFTNDTNITINSSGTAHSLGWNGLLSTSRGGTGVNITGLPADSVLFKDGSVVSGDSNFIWDNNFLKLGNTNSIFAILDTSLLASSDKTFIFPDFSGTGPGDGTIALLNSTGLGEVAFDGITSNSGNFGSVGHNRLALFSGTDQVYMNAWTQGLNVILDMSLIDSSDKTFVFPNTPGTFSLLESTQEFTGVNTFSNSVNNFISDTDSTVHIGADGIPGCIVMGDSDNSGVTYITANNGVLSASSTAPANCN